MAFAQILKERFSGSKSPRTESHPPPPPGLDRVKYLKDIIYVKDFNNMTSCILLGSVLKRNRDSMQPLRISKGWIITSRFLRVLHSNSSHLFVVKSVVLFCFVFLFVFLFFSDGCFNSLKPPFYKKPSLNKSVSPFTTIRFRKDHAFE